MVGEQEIDGSFIAEARMIADQERLVIAQSGNRAPDCSKTETGIQGSASG